MKRFFACFWVILLFTSAAFSESHRDAALQSALEALSDSNAAVETGKLVPSSHLPLKEAHEILFDKLDFLYTVNIEVNERRISVYKGDRDYLLLFHGYDDDSWQALPLNSDPTEAVTRLALQYQCPASNQLPSLAWVMKDATQM